MSDKICAFTVALQDDYNEEAVEAVMEAIKCLRGVIGVTPHVVNYHTFAADMRAKNEIKEKLFKLIQEL